MKKAADTNVVVRLIAQDDPQQLAKATALVAEGPVLVSTKVILETEWVLRSAFGYPPKRILRSFSALIALPTVELAEEERVLEAMRLHRAGLDFADALHVLAAMGCGALATFDRNFAKGAAELQTQTVVHLL